LIHFRLVSSAASAPSRSSRPASVYRPTGSVCSHSDLTIAGVALALISTPIAPICASAAKCTQ
jgi:hypothetical protein